MKQNTKETIADIAAEIRSGAADIEKNYSMVPIRREDQEADVAFLRRLADRIEAAWERERERNADDLEAVGAVAAMDAAKRELAPGNAAALRAALEQAKRIAESTSGLRLADDDKIRDIAEVCDAALAAPARNCDRFADYGEAIRAFEEASDAEDYEEMADWLFAPAAGGKGSEARNV